MGTSFRIVLYSSDSLHAVDAAEAAFDRVEELNEVFSDYLASSEIGRLSMASGSGTWTRVSEDLWRVLTDAIRISEATGGAFDVTVGALTSPWRRAMPSGRLPDVAEVNEALTRVGYELIDVDDRRRSVRLSVEAMRLDFGGIAKGYAADEALRVLRERDITSALIDAGGDLLLGCGPPNGYGWNIAVPGGVEDGMSVLSGLESIAVASSGATYQYIEADGVRYSHILDPRTGMGITAERTVSVAASTGEMADALATVVSVLGADGFEAAFALGAVWIRVRDRSGNDYTIDDRGNIPNPESSICPASRPLGN